MLARNFASYGLHMAGKIKQPEMPYFNCGSSRQEKCQSDQIEIKKRKKETKNEEKINMKK